MLYSKVIFFVFNIQFYTFIKRIKMCQISIQIQSTNHVIIVNVDQLIELLKMRGDYLSLVAVTPTSNEVDKQIYWNQLVIRLLNFYVKVNDPKQWFFWANPDLFKFVTSTMIREILMLLSPPPNLQSIVDISHHLINCEGCQQILTLMAQSSHKVWMCWTLHSPVHLARNCLKSAIRMAVGHFENVPSLKMSIIYAILNVLI